MLKYVMLLLFAFSTMGICEDQTIPIGVRQAIERYFADSTLDMSFKVTKETYKIKDITKNSDVNTGVPIQCFVFNLDSINLLNIEAPLHSLIENSNNWIVPIIIKGEYFYFLNIINNNGNYEVTGTFGVNSYWKNVLPQCQNKERMPILIGFGKKKFIHFPQIDSTNMFYLNPGKESDKLAMLTSKHIEKPDNNRVIVKYLKEDPEMRWWRERK